MRLWMFRFPEKDGGAVLEWLAELGFSDMVVGPSREQVRAVKEAGLRAHVVFGVFSLGGGKGRVELLAEDPLGRKHVWFGSGCPNNPELRRGIMGRIEEAVTGLEADGVMLDGVRFASPGSGLEAFLTCFCRHCREKAGELGLDFEGMRRACLGLLEAFYDVRRLLPWVGAYGGSPLSLYRLLAGYGDGGLLDWLVFREKSIEEFVRDVRNLLRSYGGVELGAYVFTPSLAPLVGQSYDMLRRYLDVVKPMIYRLGKGVACLNYELYVAARDLARWNGLDEDAVLGVLKRLLGLGWLECRFGRLLEDGLPVEVVGVEARRARLLLEDAAGLHPIIMLGDERIEEAVAQAVWEVDGLDFFAYREELRGYVARAVEGLRSLGALRS